jgi:YHS domain-containing protein
MDPICTTEAEEEERSGGVDEVTTIVYYYSTSLCRSLFEQQFGEGVLSS